MNMEEKEQVYKPKNHIRAVTATSLFDGHDASINLIRRIMQNTGIEVIHLGHNRSVQEIVNAAIEEDAQGVAVSSYQGGHIEFFKYMVDLLKKRKASQIKIFGGGGGVIIPEEIKELEEYGVTKIYSPEDGARMGIQRMINHMAKLLDFSTVSNLNIDASLLEPENKRLIAKLITAFELNKNDPNNEFDLAGLNKLIQKGKKDKSIPVIGITGTGGSGKSSLTDELILRLLNDFKHMHAAIISCDPSRKKTGGALLGDRIRMNAINNPSVYMRSLATRQSSSEVPDALPDILEVLKASGFDLIFVETAGIGQGDSSIIDLADVSIYVMTSEFGAASQLEKIDMLDFADLIVINKFEKRGGDDAVRDVRKQVQRNRNALDRSPEDMPVFGTIASKFNDDGVTALYGALLDAVKVKTGAEFKPSISIPTTKTSSSKTIIIPPERTRYLSEIADTIRKYHKHTKNQAEAVRTNWHIKETEGILRNSGEGTEEILTRLKDKAAELESQLDGETKSLMETWEKTRALYSQDELVYTVRNREIRQPLYTESLSHKKIPKISLPKFADPGEIYQWLRSENLPGHFPFTAGVFPLKRAWEDPTRMFAGEGDPARTNRRFLLLSENYDAKRLSTAFDSVTLYGCDPEERQDIYGKIGTSGVSICSLDDVKVLYRGFDLCSPKTSVSMTINGPAPMMLAMFLNSAIDQKVENYKAEQERDPTEEEYQNLRKEALSQVRGTVQADILKEDQGQNTCIFSTDFALKMMGDIQEYFVLNNVKNFYSVSISGYHIAEAGANPITQLALTLSNGFTYVEYYLSRGMNLDNFGPNLSFFFSNGMEPEYTVIGRVARRIWAIATREKYGASKRSQMLKYHIQTSGRSLHSQEVQFNDIRTTLQALCAVYDNCNSLHTNAYDEAITTPSADSVRRALAIQLIINREWGLAKNENMNQGSFIVEELTDLVEEAVLMEFDRITERGGVLGAMETGYQRSLIQEESLHYEMLKHSGDYPIIGVNTFRNPEADQDEYAQSTSCLPLSRATEEEKRSQLKRLAEFKKRNEKEAPAALERLQKVAVSGGNIFEELMETVRVCSLGQISEALYSIGGQYRRNM